METRLHREEHFRSSDTVRDIVIGMADGLTVPFALAAGITGAVAGNDLVVTAGVAEIAAGSVAMGLGGYLAARGDREQYFRERAREEQEIREKPLIEQREVAEIFEEYGLTREEYGPLVAGLSRRPVAWRDFMMRFELGLDEPDPLRARWSAATIGGSYVVGGLVPLAPYMMLDEPMPALLWSVALTLGALFGFGFLKGHFTGMNRAKSALQTLAIGAAAAAVAFGLARWLT